MRHVIISGFTAAGKTTHARNISEHTGLSYVSGSAIRSRLLGLNDRTEKDRGYWRNSKGARIIDRNRILKPSAGDNAVDKELIRIAESSNGCIFDVWVMPWLHREDSLCIYLRSSPETRASRLVRQSPGSSFHTTLQRVVQKDDLARSFFKIAYDVDVMFDLSPFDMIVDCNESDVDASRCLAAISDMLVLVVRLSIAGDFTGLSDVLQKAGSVGCSSFKTWVSPMSKERLGFMPIAGSGSL